MRLPIGYSDFKKVVEEEFDFVDKSLLVKEVINDAEVILITRPRRFGKTLNMSMLRYFFENTQDAAHLFKNFFRKRFTVKASGEISCYLFNL